MTSEKPAPWTGASGTEYVFYVFGLEPDVPRRLGNYIYAKRNEHGAWVPLYMGHGDLSACCMDPGLRQCIASKSATHVHLRLNGAEADRDAELQDLLAHYANVFAPEGCQPVTASASNIDPTIAPEQPIAAEAEASSRSTRKAKPKATPTRKTSVAKAAASKSKAAATARTPAVKAKPKSPRPRGK